MPQWLIIVFCICLPINALATVRVYTANIDESNWQVKEKHKIQCQLSHDIPAYGKAIFTSNASKKLNLNFTLDMWLKPNADTQVSLISKMPSWKPGNASYELFQTQFHRYFNGETSKELAWSMLRELETGMEPTFYYKDWYDDNLNIMVGLSAAKFGQKFNDFKRCLAKLLPYSYEDISFTMLSYKFGGTELTRFSQQQLERVKEYLLHDPQLDSVLIDAYTDSYGDRTINQKISMTRAQNIKDYFVDQGVSEVQIKTEGHGEDRHASSNETLNKRAKNRRVVIRIGQDI